MDSIEFCVIDDESDVMESVCENLKPLGKVIGFNSAKSALDAFANGLAPKVTIVDLKMPAMNGLEFMNECRNLYQGGAIILASGNANKTDLAKAMNLGALGFLEKPFTAGELRHAVQSVVPAPPHVLANSTDLVAQWEALANIYYETLVLVENNAMKNQGEFISDAEEKARYIRLKTKTREVRNSIKMFGGTC